MTEFSKILDHCREFSQTLTDIIFIGGVAVYLHSLRAKQGVPLEASHDADFMVSIADYGYLKDMEEVTATPRLGKHQMFSGGVEFDVYVERLNKLVVPYDEVAAHAKTIDGIRVACLEHLLVLKLEAVGDRGHTSKGEKDARDVVKLGLLLGKKVDKKRLAPYLRKDHLASLAAIAKSSVFYELAGKNAHVAKRVRTLFTTFVKSLSTS